MSKRVSRNSRYKHPNKKKNSKKSKSNRQGHASVANEELYDHETRRYRIKCTQCNVDTLMDFRKFEIWKSQFLTAKELDERVENFTCVFCTDR